MSEVQERADGVHVRAENVGGIDETGVAFSPGVTVLTGRNATNRTSFLRAIMAALGSENVSLKGDADEGRVELEFDGETYTRTLRRQGGAVLTGGDPLLDDPELADLFAFLLESNAARRAVARNDDLHELIMRPVDTTAIQADIQRFEAEKRSLDEKLETLEELDERLPELERERDEIDERIEDVEDELAEAREAVETADASVDTARAETDDLEEALGDLRDTRADLGEVRNRLETERESLASLREERADLEERAADLPADPDDDLASLDTRTESLRERKNALDTDVSELQSVIRFNENLLDGEGVSLLDDLDAADDGAAGDDAPTDRLLDEPTVCWTCGTTVSADCIRETVDRLHELREQKLSERSELRAELESATRERDSLREQRQEREQVRRDRTDVEGEIETREGRVEELVERREELDERIRALEADVEALEDADYGDLLERHREMNRLEFTLDGLEDDRASVSEELARVERELEGRERVEERRAEVTDELERLRTRVAELETDAVEAFNEHMDAILDALGYDNLERIWIERTGVEGSADGMGHSSFDLHVVRTGESGTAYEDTVDHLSESEREVTGLVFALAGYLVHDVYETVPFMLLDSLEAIDSERIATLVDYFRGYAPTIVVALLPEDAADLDDDVERVTEI